jgi:hypothetical protein
VPEPTFEEFIAWARYLTWCEDHYRRFDELMSKDPTHDSAPDYAWFVARISHWYASLWVVIEGWQELDLNDNIIGGLLRNESTLCELFQRFHDAVYHYHRNFLDRDIMALLSRGEAAIPWAHALRSEFRRFLWEWPARSGGSRNQVTAMREHLRRILGWFPDDCSLAEIEGLEALAEQANALYEGAQNRGAPEANEIRITAEGARQDAHAARRSIWLGNRNTSVING